MRSRPPIKLAFSFQRLSTLGSLTHTIVSMDNIGKEIGEGSNEAAGGELTPTEQEHEMSNKDSKEVVPIPSISMSHRCVVDVPLALRMVHKVIGHLQMNASIRT